MNMRAIVSIMVIAVLCTTILADVPNQFNFQGTLTDTGGTPISGVRNMQFFLYPDSMGGSSLWDEPHFSVEVQGGLFRVRLGTNNPLPSSVFDGSVMWLSIQVDPDPSELSPRQPLVSVPYGFQSNPDYDWTISGSDIYHDTGNVGIGTSTPWAKLHVRERNYLTTPIFDRFDLLDDRLYSSIRLSATKTSDMGDDFGVGVSFYIQDNAEILNTIGSIGAVRDGLDESGALVFRTREGGDSYERMRINAFGYVGIGTTAPYSSYLPPLIHLQNPYGVGLVIERTNPPAGKWQIGTGGNNTGSLDFANVSLGNNLHMTIETDGDVGIGVTHPQDKLDVGGDVNSSSHYKIGGTTVLSVDGTESVLVGKHAGQNNTGTQSTFVGDSAGYSNTGWNNAFVGDCAGKSNLAGYSNTFIGSDAGYGNTSGALCTFLGNAAGFSNDGGVYNTYVGTSAGVNNSGSWNTFLGTSTGSWNTNSSYNVFLGYQAGYYETGSNKLYIANSSIGPPLIYGDFSLGRIGLGTLNPTHQLTVVSTDDNTLRLIGPDGTYHYGARLNFGDDDYVYLDEDTDDKLTIHAERTAITGGFVGIGTTIPNQLLHLYSTFNPRLLIEAPSTQVPEINLKRGTTTYAMYINGGNDLVFYRAGDRVTFTDDGDVGIGNTIPQERLHVNGRVYIQTMDGTSSGSAVRWYNNRLYYQSSSKKYKDDIQPLQDDFDKILDAEPVSFTDKLSGERHIGFIAEEFADLGLDNLVIERDGKPDAIRYEMISVYLLETIKELRATTGQLAQENQVLQQRIEALESAN